jgi:hypothetical protein
MRVILDKAGTILKAAGSDLEHVVRVIQFHPTLSGVHGANLLWSSIAKATGASFSAIGVAQGHASTATISADIFSHIGTKCCWLSDLELSRKQSNPRGSATKKSDSSPNNEGA